MHFDFESAKVDENYLNYIIDDQNNSADIDLVSIYYYTPYNYTHYSDTTLADIVHYNFKQNKSVV